MHAGSVNWRNAYLASCYCWLLCGGGLDVDGCDAVAHEQRGRSKLTDLWTDAQYHEKAAILIFFWGLLSMKTRPRLTFYPHQAQKCGQRWNQNKCCMWQMKERKDFSRSSQFSSLLTFQKMVLSHIFSPLKKTYLEKSWSGLMHHDNTLYCLMFKMLFICCLSKV